MAHFNESREPKFLRTIRSSIFDKLAKLVKPKEPAKIVLATTAIKNRMTKAEAEAMGFFKAASPLGWGVFEVENDGSVWYLESGDDGLQYLSKQVDDVGDVVRRASFAKKAGDPELDGLEGKGYPAKKDSEHGGVQTPQDKMREDFLRTQNKGGPDWTDWTLALEPGFTPPPMHQQMVPLWEKGPNKSTMLLPKEEEIPGEPGRFPRYTQPGIFDPDAILPPPSPALDKPGENASPIGSDMDILGKFRVVKRWESEPDPKKWSKGTRGAIKEVVIGPEDRDWEKGVPMYSPSQTQSFEQWREELNQKFPDGAISDQHPETGVAYTKAPSQEGDGLVQGPVKNKINTRPQPEKPEPKEKKPIPSAENEYGTESKALGDKLNRPYKDKATKILKDMSPAEKKGLWGDSTDSEIIRSLEEQIGTAEEAKKSTSKDTPSTERKPDEEPKTKAPYSLNPKVEKKPEASRTLGLTRQSVRANPEQTTMYKDLGISGNNPSPTGEQGNMFPELGMKENLGVHFIENWREIFDPKDRFVDPTKDKEGIIRLIHKYIHSTKGFPYPIENLKVMRPNVLAIMWNGAVPKEFYEEGGEKIPPPTGEAFTRLPTEIPGDSKETVMSEHGSILSKFIKVSAPDEAKKEIPSFGNAPVAPAPTTPQQYGTPTEDRAKERERMPGYLEYMGNIFETFFNEDKVLGAINGKPLQWEKPVADLEERQYKLYITGKPDKMNLLLDELCLELVSDWKKGIFRDIFPAEAKGGGQPQVVTQPGKGSKVVVPNAAPDKATSKETDKQDKVVAELYRANPKTAHIDIKMVREVRR